MGINNITETKNVIENELRYNGEILLTYRIEYPEYSFGKFEKCLSGVNAYYKTRALEYKSYCENELFETAVAQYKEDIENGWPVRVFEALQAYETTYSRSCVISVYFDTYEYAGGAHGGTARVSQTLNLRRCRLLRLRRLVRCRPGYRAYILKEVEAQIEADPELYFDNYRELIVDTFDKSSFYCTPGGIVFYYQQYDIAPYSNDIREFLIPYSSCVTDPIATC